MARSWPAAKLRCFLQRLVLQHRSIGVENANDAGEVACNKPEAQAKGI